MRQESAPRPALRATHSLSHSHLGQELREGVDSHSTAQRGSQTQQPHEHQHGHLPQPPTRAPGALPQLPLSQQLLRVPVSLSLNSTDDAGHTVGTWGGWEGPRGCHSWGPVTRQR